MEIKSHLSEIMQCCFLQAILLFYYLSVLLKTNFLNNKNCKNRCSHAQSQNLQPAGRTEPTCRNLCDFIVCRITLSMEKAVYGCLFFFLLFFFFFWQQRDGSFIYGAQSPVYLGSTRMKHRLGSTRMKHRLGIGSTRMKHRLSSTRMKHS